MADLTILSPGPRIPILLHSPPPPTPSSSSLTLSPSSSTSRAASPSLARGRGGQPWSPSTTFMLTVESDMDVAAASSSTLSPHHHNQYQRSPNSHSPYSPSSVQSPPIDPTLLSPPSFALPKRRRKRRTQRSLHLLPTIVDVEGGVGSGDGDGMGGTGGLSGRWKGSDGEGRVRGDAEDNGEDDEEEGEGERRRRRPPPPPPLPAGASNYRHGSTLTGELTKPVPLLFRPKTFWRNTPRSALTSSAYSPATQIVRRATFVAAALALEGFGLASSDSLSSIRSSNSSSSQSSKAGLGLKEGGGGGGEGKEMGGKEGMTSKENLAVYMWRGKEGRDADLSAAGVEMRVRMQRVVLVPGF
ncbi:hypothetical protein BD410DRAFT_282604 [Rickenella mellea]|uniref:Uncharacterized protein n=1 Tax=Rickenella mellea TaxID=50990 RepID=A0A4Y7Q3K8_9AGAM|nr:hypothetical protein BD410DRAFT_282604 [Rickenella mellea]